MFDAQSLQDLKTYLTYEDVLLLPNYSDILPKETCLCTSLGAVELDIPILSSPMDTVTEKEMLIAMGQEGGMGILHRNLSLDVQISHLKAALEKGVQAGVAVGVGADLDLRIEKLAAYQPTVICLDSAHGHSKNILEAVRLIKQKAPFLFLIAGNVATYEGAKALFEAGADAVKVGMGPGSICTTRIMSGMGVPQLSALVDARRASLEFGRPMIADGGIKNSGDIVKALAAGASAVMLGSLLAGTEESPGEIVDKQGKLFKSYRGMGSIKAMASGSAMRYGQSVQTGQTKQLVPEGVEGLVPFRGSLHDHLHQLLGGMRAGMAYLGASTLSELEQKARFIRISPAAVAESHPHSIHQTETV